jgi:hypothetical protein
MSVPSDIEVSDDIKYVYLYQASYQLDMRIKHHFKNREGLDRFIDRNTSIRFHFRVDKIIAIKIGDIYYPLGEPVVFIADDIDPIPVV